MEFLIIAAVLLIGGYFGYQYYIVKKNTPIAYTVQETVEVKVEGFEAAVKIETPVASEKKEAKKKAPAKKAATQAKEPAKKAPAKKKPNMKIVK